MPVMFGVLLLVAAPRTPVHMAGRPWREAALGAVFGDPARNGDAETWMRCGDLRVTVAT